MFGKRTATQVYSCPDFTHPGGVHEAQHMICAQICHDSSNKVGVRNSLHFHSLIISYSALNLPMSSVCPRHSFLVLRHRLTECSRAPWLGVPDIPPIVHRAPHSLKSARRLTFPTP